MSVRKCPYFWILIGNCLTLKYVYLFNLFQVWYGINIFCRFCYLESYERKEEKEFLLHSITSLSFYCIVFYFMLLKKKVQLFFHYALCCKGFLEGKITCMDENYIYLFFRCHSTHMIKLLFIAKMTLVNY